MGTTQSSCDNPQLYKKMRLTISDEVVDNDVHSILNWFEYYGIANIKNINVRPHPEPEAYVENKPFYGYAVIEIDEWYKNNASRAFYENIIAGCAKIPHYDRYDPTDIGMLNFMNSAPKKK